MGRNTAPWPSSATDSNWPVHSPRWPTSMSTAPLPSTEKGSSADTTSCSIPLAPSFDPAPLARMRTSSPRPASGASPPQTGWSRGHTPHPAGQPRIEPVQRSRKPHKPPPRWSVLDRSNRPQPAPSASGRPSIRPAPEGRVRSTCCPLHRGCAPGPWVEESGNGLNPYASSKSVLRKG